MIFGTSAISGGSAVTSLDGPIWCRTDIGGLLPSLDRVEPELELDPSPSSGTGAVADIRPLLLDLLVYLGTVLGFRCLGMLAVLEIFEHSLFLSNVVVTISSITGLSMFVSVQSPFLVKVVTAIPPQFLGRTIVPLSSLTLRRCFSGSFLVFKNRKAAPSPGTTSIPFSRTRDIGSCEDYTCSGIGAS